MSYIERVGERCSERGLGGELKWEGKRERERERGKVREREKKLDREG